MRLLGYRDFTLLKAALLVGLIFFALGIDAFERRTSDPDPNEIALTMIRAG